jgi:hypothetical protein
VPEIQGGIEMLDQGEDIALGSGLRVPSTPSLMGDDEHLALVAAVFQGAARALADIKLPGPASIFQHRGAVHACAEDLQFSVVGHLSGLREWAGMTRGVRLSGISSVIPP